MNQQELDRFMSFVSPEPNSGCWLWTGSVTNVGGYGQISILGSPKRAHRVSYEHFFCYDVTDCVICHKCDVTSCVNPDHLFAGTHLDNATDKVSKGRQSMGEMRPLSKLKESDVSYIKLSTDSCVRLGRDLGVSRSVITKIRRGKSWRHVK